MKSYGLFVLVFMLGVSLYAKEKVDFNYKHMGAGKASLTENSFKVIQNLGAANFSPELKLPLQFVYDSSSEKSEILGYGWSIPQLESFARPNQDGMTWATPWGAEVRFFAKSTLNKDSLELYKEELKGKRDYFSPYADWEADCQAKCKNAATSGDWNIYGKQGYAGWRFTYHNAQLKSVSAPSGDTLEFSYSKDRVTKVSQNGVAFIELNYDDRQVTEIKLNGVDYKLAYTNGKAAILPKTLQAKLKFIDVKQLQSYQLASLNPVELAYDDYGYLSKVKQGEYVENLTVQHETEAERYVNLEAKADRKKKANDLVSGRILSDHHFTYKYGSEKPGSIKLTNHLKQTADYNYNAQTGIFKLTDFSGKTNTIYYFMRHDVAYLGKVRKIVDGRGRTVASYRYDKLSGNVVRIRDMAENDINFSYNNAGELTLVTCRAADQNDPKPVMRLSYNEKNDPNIISHLDEKGQPVLSTRISYNDGNRPVRINDGRINTQLSYNKFGYPNSVTNVFGQTNRILYDTYNRITKVTDHYGVDTNYTWDVTGMVERIERVDSKDVLNSLTVAYDANGRAVSYTDQQDRVKKFERDEFGRVIKEFFPDETSVEYSYNDLGQLATVFDQNKHEIKFDWSRFGLDKRNSLIQFKASNT